MKNDINKFVKAAVVLAIAVAMFVPASAVGTDTKTNLRKEFPTQPMNRDTIFSDSFETYEDFIFDDFPPWSTFDGDGGATWGMEGVTWTNAGYIGAYMIFNPSQTDPPIDGSHPAHTGEKYASCWASMPPENPNDDWMITPQLAADTFEDVSFWARSLTNQYGLERFQVGVSTTTNDPGSFTFITPAPYVNASTAWTHYTYDISSYTGQLIYIAIHCVSNDAFGFFVDDFEVTGTGGVNPLIPDAGGPYAGYVGETIAFTGSATGGTAPYTYSWDFGNGDTSAQQNPSYAYDAAGVYTVELTVTDSEGKNASDNAIATISSPIQITSIAGGLGVSAMIKNVGSTALTNIDWTISLDGGFILLGKTKSGTIDSLGAGEEIKIKSFIFGFGKTVITVSAAGAEDSANGTVLLFFVLGVA